MIGTRILMSGLVAAGLLIAGTSNAQLATTTQRTPRVIVINLIEVPGAKMPFAFQPLTFTAERGDILEFVQQANTMHNVHFKTQAKGAKLGSAATSPYLIAKGQTYKIVVDSRFTDGTYEIVCEPHEMIGMHAMLTVVEPGAR